MRFLRIVPVIALATAFAVTACQQEDTVEEGTELTPADTAMTTPPRPPTWVRWTPWRWMRATRSS